MENFWLETAKQAPSLCVLVFLVLVFLKHLKEDGDRRERLEQQREASLRALGDSCHEFQKEMSVKSAETITRNTTALERNTEALGWHSRKINGSQA